MKKTKFNFLKGISIILIYMFLFTNSVFAASSTAALNNGGAKLKVALYPYVPNPQQVKNVFSKKWAEKHPNVPLEFVEWDCYSGDPAKDTDVFVFDSMYFTHYLKKGYLESFSPNEINNKEDIFKFALAGCEEGGKMYAIPQLLCTNLLFYRKNDVVFRNVNNIEQLHKVLGNNDSEEIPPPSNKGLLINLSGGTTKVCMYLQTLIDVDKHYQKYDKFPELNNDKVFDNLRSLINMAGKKQSQFTPDDRAKWFAAGQGRAYIGYTESMANMGDVINDIEFKSFSLSNCCDIPVFYSDVVGVNSNSSQKVLAKELANLITSSDAIVEAMKPEGQGNPQYLLPARESSYVELGKDFKVYSQLLNIVKSDKNYIFRLGDGEEPNNIYKWIKDAKAIIVKKLDL